MLVCLCQLTLLSAPVQAGVQESQKLMGTVLDANTHLPIHSVSVLVIESEIGTTTDAAGRFTLRLPEDTRHVRIAFRHVGYKIRDESVTIPASPDVVYLVPKIIPLPAVEVSGSRDVDAQLSYDLPARSAVFRSGDLAARGYVDAGEALRQEHTVQVEESLSGKKELSIRGGNADEVGVHYAGFRLNSQFDNLFNLALIDVETIGRLSLIKGSNTTLFGPSALGGIVLIEPKLEQAYTLRLHQRIGTYNSGAWGLNFYRRASPLRIGFNMRKNGASRRLVADGSAGARLRNTGSHYAASVDYATNATAGQTRIRGFFFQNNLNFRNARFDESRMQRNSLLAVKMKSGGGLLSRLDISTALRRGTDTQRFNQGEAVARDLEERAFDIHILKPFDWRTFNLTLGLQHNRAALDVNDEADQLEGVSQSQSGSEMTHSSLAAVIKHHGETGSSFLKTLDLDAGIRFDLLRDRPSGNTSRAPRTWRKSTLRFSAHLTGLRKNLLLDLFVNFGGNVKFPSLSQLLDTPAIIGGPGIQPNLRAETSKSLEMAGSIVKEQAPGAVLDGWQIDASFFQNTYSNKLREFFLPFQNIVLFDNVVYARISGFESSASMFFFDKKVTVQWGIARYFLSDKSAFAFKSELKRNLTATVQHAGSTVRIHWFREGSQEGLLRGSDGRFSRVVLDGFTNLDVYLGIELRIRRQRAFASLAGRNLLNQEGFALSGIAIRDRRLYATFGIKL